MVNEVLHEAWRERLESFAREGKTVRVWCAEHGMAEHQFHYWRRRLTQPAKAPGSAWMAVEVVAESVPGGVAIRVGRVRVEVQSGFDAALLRAVVGALEAMPC